MAETIPLRETSVLDMAEPWLRHLGDNKHFSKLLENWNEVSLLDPTERMLSEAAFGILCHHGIFKVKVVFSKNISCDYLVNREKGVFELELRSDYSGRTVTDLIKFVRYTVMTELGRNYIPDVRCFSDIICPTSRNDSHRIIEHYRTFKHEMEKRKHVIWSPRGNHKNLLDSVQRLLDSGLITPDDIRDSRFAWSQEDITDRLGWCCLGIGVVILNKAYDAPDVEDEVVDFIVYHECLHLRQRFKQVPMTGEHDEQFRKWESLYPDMKKWELRASEIAYDYY